MTTIYEGREGGRRGREREEGRGGGREREGGGGGIKIKQSQREKGDEQLTHTCIYHTHTSYHGCLCQYPYPARIPL